MRDFIERCRTEGRLRNIRAEVDPNLEAAAIIKSLDEEPVIFDRIKGSRMRAAANLLAAREMLARALNTPGEALLDTLNDAVKHRAPCPITPSPACQEKVLPKVNLNRLPILKHFKGDGGPYITAAVLIVNCPEFGPNASFHRMMLIGPDTFSVRVVENRGTHRAIENAGGSIEAAVCIAPPPQMMIAAAMSPPPAVNELEIANKLAPMPLAQCLTNHIMVPAFSEIVLEGKFTGESADEGPFVDLTCTWDGVRKQPVFKVEAVTAREDAIYEALLPGKAEHKTLMGLPREADIFRAVSRKCNCLDVRITRGGCSWLHAVVQLDKQKDDDPKNAIESAFIAHPSLKTCIVVDKDVNPGDHMDVEWALATRFQADRDAVIMSNKPSSSLDPSAKHEQGKKATGSKLGMDATIKGDDPEKFTRVSFPTVDPQKLKELLNG